MITQRMYPLEFISIVPPRIAEAESRLSLDQLRARFARNDGLPFAEVLTGPRIRAALDEHGVRYRDRVFDPVTTIWGFLSQVLSDDHSCRDAVLVEGLADAGSGQDVGEREALVAREAGAELIQAQLGLGFGDSGRDDRDKFSRVDSLSDHVLYYDGLSSNVHFAI